MGCDELDEITARLRVRLGGAAPLPGPRAQARMAPRPRRTPGDHEELADAAVLVLLYPGPEGASIVLTRRADTVGRHASQVSLPGGRQEGGESLEQAALRECAEELAVEPGSVTVLGRLSPLDVHASGFRIHPVVGTADARPDFEPDPREVASIIEVPLRALDPSVREETWTYAGLARQVPFFLVQGHKIWGATAMILSELLAVLRESGWTQPDATAGCGRGVPGR